jgi:uncharacterized protein (TIGR02594 family)
MNESQIGIKVVANVDGVVKGFSTASASVRDFGKSAQATQAQIAALNKQALDTARSVTEGYKGLGAALGMSIRPHVVKVDTTQAWAALDRLGKKQLEAIDFANRMASSSTSLAIEKQKALEVQLTKNAEGWKKLGDMGKRQYDISYGSQMARQMAAATLSTETLAAAYKKTDLLGQGFFGKMKMWFADTAMGQKMMANESEKSAKRMVAANEKVGISIRGWLPHIRTAAASIGIYLGVRTITNLVRVADTFTEMGARLRLVSGNTQELARAQEGLFKIAQSNRAPLTDVVNLYFKLGNSMRDLGVSQKDVLQTVDTVGKAMRVSGASTIEISAAMQQLSQAFAKGKLDGDEFRSTMENAPRLMRALTDEFGISKDELYKWSETGRLSVEKLVQAIKNQSKVIEQEFKTIPVTISGAWQKVSNAFAKYVGDADNATESSMNLAKAINYLAERLDVIIDAAIWPVNAIEGWKQMAAYAHQISVSLQSVSNSNALDKLSAAEQKRVYDMYGINRAVDPAKRFDAGSTALTTAQGYLGWNETGQKQELIDFLNKYSGTVFKDVAGDVNAWCARFVSAVLQQNGIQNPQTASARAFAQFGQSVWKQGDGDKGMENVKPGDIVVFTRGKSGHVAFVNSVDLQKRTMDVLGGNQGNAVSVRRRSFDDPNLMTIRRAVGGGEFFTGRNQQVEKLTSTLYRLTDIQKMIVEKSIKAGVDPTLMLGLAQRESRFNPNAVADPSLVRGRGYEKTGMGLYQFLPGTGSQYGLMNDADRKNAEKATDAAIAHLKDLLGEFSGDMTKALAAWNMGAPNLRRHLRNGEDPQQFTEGPHVQRILEYRKQWDTKLKGVMPDIMGAGDIEKQNKAFEKVLDDQFESYGKHLKRLEDERAAYNTVDLDQQRTQMEKLEAQREQMRKADEAAMAVAQGSGNMDAVRQASATAAQHEIKFLKEKNQLLLDGMKIEYDAMAARKGHVQQQIADAQKNGGQAALAAIPDLRSESKQLDAQMKALAEQRKQLEIKANAEIVAATRQAEDEKRKSYRETADIAVEVERNRREAAQVDLDQAKQRAGDFVAMQQQRIEGLQAEFAIQKELANISAEAFGQYAEQQRGAIDLSLERAKAEFENRDAQRQAMLEGKEGLDAIIQARENLNARLQDQLALLAQERDATVQKLDLTRQELEYQKRLAEWQLQRTQAIEPNDLMAQLQAKQKIADIEGQIAQNIQAQAKANETLAKEQAKAQGDAMRQGQRLDTQEVKESQLRMNAFWDQYISRIRDYASIWQEITGETENGWSRMAVAAGEYAKQYAQINQYWQSDDAKKAWGDMSGLMEAMQQGQAAAAMMAKTMLAARENTEKGSQEYDNLTMAAENFMQVLQLLNVAEGIAAVLKQLKDGDSYTAAIRAAGVAMMVASMGINTGFGGGGSGGMSNRQAREAAQAGGSTSAGGGVFGDTSAKSDSISKSLEIVSQNSSADLAYSAGMLRALTDIKYALMGTTNAVIRNVGPQTGLNLNPGKATDIARGMLDPIGTSFAIGAKIFGDPLSKLMAKLSQFLLNTTKKITDWGLAATQQSLSTILKGGFHGQGFTDVTTTTKVLGITVQKSTKRYFAELNGAVNSEFTRAIVGVANTVAEAGKAFGLGAKDFEDRLKGFVVNFGAISTKGLKGQELQDALTQMFSAMSDDMARAFLPGLDAFMQSGEGYLTTLVRVSDGINRSTGILEQAGLTAINYQDIVLKQGDVAAEIVRQSIVMFEGIGSAIGAYVDQAVGSAEELMSVYQDLLIVSDTAKLAGFNINNLSNALIVTSGGVAQFLENLTTYQTEILGSSDYARQMLTLTREFQKLSQAVPANNAAFVKLVDSIDTTTESGQKLYAQILSLAGAFSKAQQEAAKLQELREKYTPQDSMIGYRKQLEQVKTDFKQITEGVLAAMPGGPNYLKRIQRIESLGNLREDRQDELAVVNEDIAKLEAKGKLTAKEKQTLASLRQQRKDLEAEIKDTDKLIAQINKLIEKNKNTKGLIDERNKIIEEQGNAIIQTIADIWDKMTQAINAAKETLISIQNDIFELNFTAGSTDIKLGMANAKKITAETAYYGYTGDNIEELNRYASALHQAIMAEYQAKMDAIMAPKIALEKERDLAQKAHDEQIQALEKQLATTRELFDAIKSIQEYAKSLRTSAAANLSPKKQLDAARTVYDELLAKAKTGDVEAMRQITGASDAYLDAARKYFGSGGKYGQIFDGIVSAMDSLGMTDAGDAQSIQDKIDELNKNHEAYLKGIEDKIAALGIDQKVKDLQKNTADELDKLAKDLGPRITRAEEKAREDMQKLILEVQATNILNDKQLQALNKMLESWGMGAVAGPTPTTPEPPPLAYTDDEAMRIYEAWLKTQTGYKKKMPAFASGGMAQPGWALVGEEGPELVKFGSQAQIFAADATQRMLRQIDSFQPIPSQAPRPINLEKMPRIMDDIRRPDRNPAKFSGSQDDVVAELKAMRAELKALVTTQSRANPAVIEQLANIERRLGYMERDAKLKPA